MAAWTETIKVSVDEHGHVTVRDDWGMHPRVLVEGEDVPGALAAFGVKLAQTKEAEAIARHEGRVSHAREQLKTAQSRQRSIVKASAKNEAVYNATGWDWAARNRIDNQIKRWVNEVMGESHWSPPKPGSWKQRLADAHYDAFSGPQRKKYERNIATLVVLAAYWAEQEQRWANELATEQAA